MAQNDTTINVGGPEGGRTATSSRSPEKQPTPPQQQSAQAQEAQRRAFEEAARRAGSVYHDILSRVQKENSAGTGVQNSEDQKSKEEKNPTEVKDKYVPQKPPRTVGERVAQEFYEIVRGGPVEIIPGNASGDVVVNAAEAQIILPDNNNNSNTPPTVEQVTDSIRKMIHRMNDSQVDRAGLLVRRMRQMAQDTSLDPETVRTLEENANKIYQIIQQRRQTTAGTPEFRAASSDAKEFSVASADAGFAHQVFAEYVQFMTGKNTKVNIQPGNGVSVIRDGNEIRITLPPQADLRALTQLKEQMRIQGIGEHTQDKSQEFALQLQDAAYLMASMNVSQEERALEKAKKEREEGKQVDERQYVKPVFSDTAIATLYNASQALLNPQAAQETDPEKVAKEVTKQANSEEVTQKFKEVNNPNAPENMRQTRKDEIFLKVFMGKDTTYTVNGKAQETFFDQAYDRLFARWAKREAEKDPHVQKPLNREGFAQSMAENMGGYVGILSESIDRFLDTGGGGQSLIAKVAERTLTEAMSQDQLNQWVDAVREKSVLGNEALMQATHRELFEARKAGAQTPEEEIKAVNALLQSPKVVDQLQYVPGDIRQILDKGGPQTGEELLWDRACNIKVAYALDVYQRLGYQVGVRLDGNHVYLVIDVNGKILRVDPSTPQQIEENGIVKAFSGVDEITDGEELEKAREAIAKNDGKDIIVGSLYHNLAMQLQQEGKDSGTVISLLNQALAANPDSAISLWAKGKILNDPEAMQQALKMDNMIAGKYAFNKRIGLWTKDQFNNAVLTVPIPLNPTGNHDLQTYIDQLKELQSHISGLGNIDDRDLKNILIKLGVAHANNPGLLAPYEPVIDALRMEWSRRQSDAEDEVRRKSIETELFKGRGEIKVEHREDFKKVYDIAEKKRQMIIAGTPELFTKDQEAKAVKILKEVLANYNINGADVSHDLVELAGQFDETREMLINQILFEPYRALELSRYSINEIYVAPYLNILMNSFTEQRLRYEAGANAIRATNAARADQLMQEGRAYQEKRSDYKKIQTAIETFHNMNADIVKGDMRDLSIKASEMQKDQFEYMAKISGFGEAMMLYEDEFRKELAAEGQISPEGMDRIREAVRERLKEMSKAGLIRSKFETPQIYNIHPPHQLLPRREATLDDWEVDRAIFAGRAFFNVFMRAGSFIAAGNMPSGVEGGNSVPQEKIAELLNFMHVIIRRWEIGGGKDTKAGQVFMDDFQRNWFAKLRETGYKVGDKDKQLYRAGGFDIDTREMAAYSMESDFMSSWRIANIAFPSIYGDYNNTGNPGDEISLKAFLDEKVMYKGKQISRLDRYHEYYKDKDERTLRTELRDLVDKTDLGLGVFLTYKGFWDTVDPRVGLKGRELAWQKIARTNLPVMMDFLRGFEGARRDKDGMLVRSSDGKPISEDIIVNGEKVKSLEEILGTEPRLRAAGYAMLDPITQKWVISDVGKTFLKQLRIKMEHDRKVFELQARNKKPTNSLLVPQVIGHQLDSMGVGTFVGGGYTAEEQEAVRAIQYYGQLAATPLANVVWNNVPVLDVPFEDLQFGRFGSNEFQRKMGDAADESNAGNVLYGISLNAGGKNQEAFFEEVQKLFAGIENPEGTGAAIMRYSALHRTRLEWVQVKLGQRWGPWDALKGVYGHRSKAQDYAGKGAEALIEMDMAAEIDAAQRMGFLSAEDAKKLKKLTKSWWGRIIWAFFRDAFIFVLYNEAADFVEITAGDELGMK